MTTAPAASFPVAAVTVKMGRYFEKEEGVIFHMRAIKAIAANMAVDLGVKVERG